MFFLLDYCVYSIDIMRYNVEKIGKIRHYIYRNHLRFLPNLLIFLLFIWFIPNIPHFIPNILVGWVS